MKRKRSRLASLLRVAAALVLLLVAVVASFYRPDIPHDEMRRRWADERSQFLSVLGTEVHVKDETPPDAPDAPILLLLHGTASSLHTWDGWARELGDRFRIVRFDLQGYGLTGPNPESDYSIDRQIRVGEALLDRLGIASAVVAGNSLGGYVAWRWALAHPQRVDALVLVDAAGYPASALVPEAGGAPPEPRRNALSLSTTPVVGHLVTKLTPRFLVQNALEDVYGDPSRVEQRLVQRHHDMLLAAGNRRALRDALVQGNGASVSEVDLWRRIPEISQPALVLWGGRDDWIPLAAGTRFHRDLPDSELIVYPEAGHVPMEEIPVETARDVAAWLETRRSPAEAL